MAKKAVAAPAVSLEASPKKKGKPTLNINAKLEYFWDMAELAWNYCDQYQDRIVLVAPYLTKAFITEQLEFIGLTKQLPNNDVRSADNTRSLQSVQKKRKTIVDMANVLDAALRRYTLNAPAAYQVEHKASGLASFREVTASNYPAVSVFITTGTNYLDTYGQQLVDAGALSAEFKQEFKDAGTAFNKAKQDMNTTRQTSKNGTDTVVEQVDKIKLEIRLMQDFGKAAFKNEPEIVRYFTEEYLMDAVRSKHPAGLNGRTTWPKEAGMEKAKPVAGLKVEVLGDSGKSAVTNKQGRFQIKQLSAGEHRVRVSGPTGAGESIQPVELLVTLRPGINFRQNVTVEPAPVMVMEAKEATPPLASMNEVLNKAMQDVKVNANGESATSNGQMTSQNGHAVA